MASGFAGFRTCSFVRSNLRVHHQVDYKRYAVKNWNTSELVVTGYLYLLLYDRTLDTH